MQKLKSGFSLSALVCLAFVSFLGFPVFAQTAGRVLAVSGTAILQRAEEKQSVLTGTVVRSGDVLTVADQSALQVRFTDESIVALHSNSQLKIEAYRFDKNPSSDRSVLALLKGGMRTITGLIGRGNPKNYEVHTATSTIGIRGTHFSVVSCQNDCMRADGSSESNGTFGSVSDGRITINNQAGQQEFFQQEFFYVATPQSAPLHLLAPPAVLSIQDLVVQSPGIAATVADAKTIGNRTDSGQRAGTQTSTSPQLTAQKSPSVALTAPLTQSLATDLPIVNDVITNRRITGVAAYGVANSSGIFTQATSRTYSALDLSALAAPILATSFTDAALLAAAISGIQPVSSNPAAAAYWTYVNPAGSPANSIGYHLAWGDAPLFPRPVTGVASYNYVGGTLPTDNYGRVGTFSGSTLLMNFGTQTVTNASAMTFSFGTNAQQTTPTIYSIPANASWTMLSTPQTLLGTTCITGCLGSTVGTINGSFVGNRSQGYIAAINISNTQLDTLQKNALGTAAVFAKP